jgi:hypothetical protein
MPAVTNDPASAKAKQVFPHDDAADPAPVYD